MKPVTMKPVTMKPVAIMVAAPMRPAGERSPRAGGQNQSDTREQPDANA
jgi:hypothetical protein